MINIGEWDSYLDQWDKEVSSDNPYKNMTADELLAMFDDNGKLIEDDHCEKVIKDVDELLALFDDDGKLIVNDLSKIVIEIEHDNPYRNMTADELLAMFNEDGKFIEFDHVVNVIKDVDDVEYDDGGDMIEKELNELLNEWEEVFGDKEHDNLLSIEEFLARFDDNGNKINPNEDDIVEEINDNPIESMAKETKANDVEKRTTKMSQQKRRTRRGGKKPKKDEEEKASIKIIHSNCDGYSSKKESIEEIIKNKTPDVFLLNDTALNGNRKVRIKNYLSFCKNRKKFKGGVATFVSEHLRSNVVKVAEGEDEKAI